jgi:calcium-dependent protein kinase
MFRREMRLISECDHPNIIKGIEAFEDSTHLYMVMEECSGGELFDRIKARKKYTEKDACDVLRQLGEGIAYLHDNKIAHCDLKPDNFLFKVKAEHSAIKIIDFGLSKMTRPREYMSSLRGTSFYMAPEVFKGKYTYHCDMWSYGIVMFIMLFGFPPFHGSDSSVKHGIQNGFSPITKDGWGPWFPSSINVSENAKDLISKLLDSDPAVRLTAHEALEHPWFSEASNLPLPNIVLTNLETFTQNCKFKTVVLAAMAHALSEKDLASIRTAFREMDTNKDGSITVDELKRALTSQGVEESDSKISDILALVDVNGDGKLSYQEIVMSTVQKKLMAKEDRIYNTVRQLDVNHDGTLSPDEIETVLGKQDDIKGMVAEIDKNGDGAIDYDEFVEMFLARSQQQSMDAIGIDIELLKNDVSAATL